MFLGEYEHSIDTKGRLAVPAKFRPQLGDGLVVTRGFDRCLQVYPVEQWSKLALAVSALPVASPAARQLRRLLFSSAADIELDRQGRILLPANLREYAGIEDLAVVSGMNTYFEIWAKDAWETTLAGIAENGGNIAEAIAGLGL